MIDCEKYNFRRDVLTAVAILFLSGVLYGLFF